MKLDSLSEKAVETASRNSRLGLPPISV
jgi:hypothetical protein